MRLGIVWMAALLAAGCSGKDPTQPGVAVGTFKLQGHKASATCGDATAAPDPWLFDVRFSRDDATLYWVQNRAPISGHVGADRKVRFETRDARTMTAQVRKGTPVISCTVTRTDTFDAVLGPDEPLGDAGTGGFSTLTGTLRYSFSADDPEACASLGDPSLSVMPCELVYDIRGAKK